MKWVIKYIQPARCHGYQLTSRGYEAFCATEGYGICAHYRTPDKATLFQDPNYAYQALAQMHNHEAINSSTTGWFHLIDEVP